MGDRHFLLQEYLLHKEEKAACLLSSPSRILLNKFNAINYTFQEKNNIN